MAKTPNVGRAAMPLTIKKAQQAGMSQAAWIRDMRSKGLGYRRQTMQSDWRNMGNIKKKEGLLRYVRKDYLPTAAIAQVKDWELSREYMFKLRVRYRESPGRPIQERYVNLVEDRPLTPREMEAEVRAQWGGWYGQNADDIVEIIPETAIQRQN